ncbi:hypothetical protein BS50DRAFT_588164 [Corynespora cassiicola Philippines]|uniref:Heterokaryon incompatibility domain-containing protein n=1 Tax=Corynespora cassiicola Philippines TaxID=1448308 RepID=A0A2T2NNZ8_CORCC|nr:hypothetical protein BS50DRAFT_588164 [Corynespora cassiicola Philippines]
MIYKTPFPNAWPKHDLPLFRMLDSGCCLNKLAKLEKDLSTSSLAYVSMMKRTDGSGRSHETCTKRCCKSHNIDRETYRSLHTSAGCSCHPVGPTRDELNAALDKGGFPIMRLRDGSVDIVDSAVLPEYTAISHVWSDGMGNLHGNKLPWCQLERLHKMVLRISNDRSSLFWLDTICVPWRNDEHNRRRVAIGRMRRTYEQAKSVLVVSADLTTVPSLASPTEHLLRIGCSGWMRRLWTLQEGALAQRLYFQFSDGAKSLDELVAQVMEKPGSAISMVEADAVQIAHSFQRFSNMECNMMEEAYNALQWRNTSWQQDEALCLSILLDLDAEKISGTEGEDRMWTLLAMLPSLPASLMFAPGKRIDKHGYRWAPQTMMNKEGFTMPLGHGIPPAILGQLGIMVTFPGFILHPRSIPNRDISFCRVDGDLGTYRIANLGPSDGGKSWTEDGPWNISNPAIVVGPALAELLNDENGALVSIHRSERGVLMTEYHSRVHIHRESNEELDGVFDSMWNAEAKKSDITANLGYAEILASSQRWLIS